MAHISQSLHILMCHVKVETDYIVPGLLGLAVAIVIEKLATSKK
jgi:hypothetical protein